MPASLAAAQCTARRRCSRSRGRAERASRRASLSPLAVRSYETRGRARAGGGVPPAHAVPARPRPDRPLQGVPPAEGQDAGLHRPRRRPLRTRMTHTLETTGIARGVARALRLNEDLVEAIGLGHDMGHPPFGHAGEEALDAAAARALRAALPPQRAVAARLDCSSATRGSTSPRRCATASSRTPGRAEPATLEGKIVRLVDRVAYINHDIDDAIRAGSSRPSDLPRDEIELLGDTGSRRIDTLVHDLVETSAAPATSPERRDRRARCSRCAASCSSASTSARRSQEEHRRAAATVRADLRPPASHPAASAGDGELRSGSSTTSRG